MGRDKEINMSKVDDVIEKYEEKFGGVPYFLIMGASDEYIIEALSKCIETGKELKPDDPNGVY